MGLAAQRYPWDLIDSVGRDAVRLASRVRPLVERSVALARVAESVKDALGCDCHLLDPRLAVGAAPDSEDGVTLHFDLDGAICALWFEGDLAATLVARVLGSSAPFASPDSRVDPLLAGSLAAIVVEVTRRAGTRPVSVRREPPPGVAGLQVALTALLDDRPYRLRAWACSVDKPTDDLAAPSLEALGGVSIAVPLVAAVSTMTAAEGASLEIGDVWMPGSWSAVADQAETRGAGVIRGSLALVAPASDRGVWVDGSPEGQLVLTARIASLDNDATETQMPNAKEVLAETVLDAPIVVRVEVGAVTMTARQWSELRPGDVLETGRRLGAPVILRVAGREVARGELVNVEGELGVRIREIVDAGEPV